MYRELSHYREALQTYIEATYHVSDPRLVELRRQLLSAPGAIAQEPYLESTPRYDSADARRFASLALPDAVRQLLSHLGSPNGGLRIFDPPYAHQAEALEATFTSRPDDLVVTTGTGSGKTETFLLPVLATMAHEASSTPQRFQRRAIRALLLYPMNALVNDQLGRLRTLFGSDEVAGWFIEQAGRPMKFARYTGKALYPGARCEDTARHSRKLQSLRFYTTLEAQAREGDTESLALIAALRDRGKWPSKPGSSPGYEDGMSDWLGTGRWKNASGQWQRTVERASDPELLIRQECHEAPPDLLVTNYSMLEYMLLRPVERSLFAATREFYAEHTDARLILVLDEAHLYRGAQGTEVAMLIRRLGRRLGLPPSRVQVFCTSASFSDPNRAAEFSAGLTGKQAGSFRVLEGEKVARRPAGAGTRELAEVLAALDLGRVRSGSLAERVSAVMPLLGHAAVSLRAFHYEISCAGASPPVTLLVRGVRDDATEGEETVDVPVEGKVRTTSKWALVTSVVGPPDITIEVQPLDLFDDDDGGDPEVRYIGAAEVIGPDRDPLPRLLFDALGGLPVSARLVNLTSGAIADEDAERDDTGVGPAQGILDLGPRLFPSVPANLAREATDVLVELCSAARYRAFAAPLLPARVHAFFRGLPGLWACCDPDCGQIDPDMRGGPTGKVFAQPQRVCECGARAFELYTCRNCGTAYFKAYASEPRAPAYLWPEDVGEVDDDADLVSPVYVCLQAPPVDSEAVVAELEMETGRIHSTSAPASERVRDVWLPAPGTEGNDGDGAGPGKFEGCPHCGSRGQPNGRNYPIQDHVTKGDQPFQTLVSAQLLSQPERRDVHTPLRGRKTLIFSDGRQAASRLAGTLKQMSLRDSVRPLLLDGFRLVHERFDQDVALSHTYIALLVSCVVRDVHLRPAEAPHFDEDLSRVKRFWNGEERTYQDFLSLSASLNQGLNRAIMGAVYPILNDRHTGLSALALATVKPVLTAQEMEEFAELEPPPAVESSTDDERRRRFLSLWLVLGFNARSVVLPTTPAEWIDSDQSEGARIRRTDGRFAQLLQAHVERRWYRTNMATSAGGQPGPWLIFLLRTFGMQANANGHLLRAEKIALDMDVGWVRCARCTTVQPSLLQGHGRCIMRLANRACGGEVVALDPLTESVFRSRKGFYLSLAEQVLAGGATVIAPHPFVAEEHSAALGDTAGSERAIGWAEWHELRFQDLDVEGPEGSRAGPIDVLSCTTTMEVGIDIGSLAAVALRNVPPGRANYQQRAGRAGRRGSSLATVITYCDSDSHDQRFFRDPAGMVSGPVSDPALNLDNVEIIRRHAFALLLSEYQQAAIATPAVGDAANSNVFESLGMLDEFQRGTDDAFSYRGLAAWLDDHRDEVRRSLVEIVPPEFAETTDVTEFVERIPQELLDALERVGAGPLDTESLVEELATHAQEDQREDGIPILALETLDDVVELDDVEGENTVGTALAPSQQDTAATDPDAPADSRRLLDRLFDTGVLPRYAFPTDVVSFNVFSDESDRWRAIMRYTPSLGLNQALSAYAPGREVWVNGVRHYSLAVWTPFILDRIVAYRRRRLYFECSNCGYGRLEDRDGALAADRTLDCSACGARGALGPAMRWFQPPGFAHPPDVPTQLALVDQPRATRATQAKLSAAFGDGGSAVLEHTSAIGSGYSIWSDRQRLLVTNTGSTDPQRPGFLYCPRCGRTEPNGWGDSVFRGNAQHRRPYPNHGNQTEFCDGRPVQVALGNEFLTDIALIRFTLGTDVVLPPGSVVARVVMTTLASALSAAAAEMLDVEISDIRGEYRVALTPHGRNGRELEVYLYDLAAGGAGFVRAAAEQPGHLLDRTHDLLTACTCQQSCYNCLRSYQNKWEHAFLDRHLAADLLTYCTNGSLPYIRAEQEKHLLDAMAVEMRDAGYDAIVDRSSVHLPGLSNRRVVLSHPLAPGRPGTPGAKSWDNPVVISQLTAERALPTAVQLALAASPGVPSEWRLAPFFTESPDGIPVYRPGDLVAGLESATVRTRVSIPQVPDGAFVTQLETDSMEARRVGTPARRVFDRDAWVIWMPTDPDDFDRQAVQLLVSTAGAFGATGERWTIGSPLHRGAQDPPTVRINYYSRNPRCRSQAVPANEVRSIARIWAVFTNGAPARIG